MLFQKESAFLALCEFNKVRGYNFTYVWCVSIKDELFEGFNSQHSPKPFFAQVARSYWEHRVLTNFTILLLKKRDITYLLL